ncbi:MAG: class I SAM-dependent methyltransferase [Actinomyces graevenitzii]|nr:class I SAM-dependent methyltransferase [Actinomyces graevenitzii]
MPKAPRLTAKQASLLRADLAQSGWGVESVEALLGPVAAAALQRELRAPALRVVRRALAAGAGAASTSSDRPSPATGAASTSSAANAPQDGDVAGYKVAVLTALFMLGEPVGAAALETALPRTGVAGALAIGLVVPTQSASGEQRYAPAVDLRPHEAEDAHGSVRWWVASDLGELVTGQALAPDHVLGIGRAGLTLAALTPRKPVETALDLGVGCGIQTLYLLRHVRQVVATDISTRALEFTAFNVALAGVDSARVQLRQGNLLEPVAGQRFDLIVSNPPFVITPPSVRQAGLPLMEYRDAGGPILPALVRGLEDHLNPDGVAVMLGNWEHREGTSWRTSVNQWIGKSLDAWIIQREVQDPVEYAAMWLRDGGLTPERSGVAFENALAAWQEDFDSRQVSGVGMGYLVFHAPVAAGAPSGLGGAALEGQAAPEEPASDAAAPGAVVEPWRVLEEVPTSGQGALGEHVAQVIAAHEALRGLDDAQVAALKLRTASGLSKEEALTPTPVPTAPVIRQAEGFGRVIAVGMPEVALLSASDEGLLTVAQIAAAVASLTSEDPAAVLADMVAATRTFAHAGMVTIV